MQGYTEAVHLQINHDISKDFSLLPTRVFDILHLLLPQVAFSSNPLFNWNFHFLSLCFNLINRFRHQPAPVLVKENFDRNHVGYTHGQTNTRGLSSRCNGYSDRLRNRSDFVLQSLSGKYPWER